ncbi:thiamine phosphate synthase [Ectothiorhodospiraceae bacterium 2226]|nr:thiamine phosphate synthase [Ectothiorhodospiraceae bacterium 2226]
MIALQGLYVVTPELADDERLSALVSAALAGGARAVQYRAKHLPPAQRQRQAAQLAALCRRAAALFIVNDDADLAAAVGADGVHIGREDAAIARARARLPHGLIGVSCYNRLDLAQAAQAAGADYVAFGRFFPSRTKPDAVQADPALLREARAVLRVPPGKPQGVPLVAIGGITAENGRRLVEAGADMLAVIDGVFGRPDVEAAARALAALFPAPPPP